MRFALGAALAGLALAACVPAPATDLPMRINSRVASAELPALQRFAPAPVAVSHLSNADIARDFLDLTFRLESGRPVDRFTRFEGPVSVQLVATGDTPPPLLQADLDDLIARLRAEAGIDIRRGGDGANIITINAVPRAMLRRFLPEAACFVIPNVTTFEDFRRARRSDITDWTRLTRRTRMAVFLPSDVAPQEVRDCLHEELAQALGPVNDLYRLPGSVFNDDNVHTVLTQYDMLILRATYAPELRNGMTRRQVAAQLPALLSRLNPGGDRLPPRRADDDDAAWVAAVQRALGPGAGQQERIMLAQRALVIAQTRGWQDNRRGFSHYILGRLTSGSNRAAARAHFIAADTIFARDPDLALHRAFTAAQLAADALRSNAPAQALARLDPAIAAARDGQNAALLATLLLLQAEALDQSGQPDSAARVRLDSLGWARYGFGSDRAVTGKAREVSALRSAEQG